MTLTTHGGPKEPTMNTKATMYRFTTVGAKWYGKATIPAIIGTE